MGSLEAFGKYQLVERIGAGGMAEIYLARHLGAEGLEKSVVIKRIRPEHAQKPRFIAMFVDEAKIAVGLNHPNIAQVYEFGREGRDFYLAMEHVDGVDLGRLQSAARRQARALPVGDVVYIGIELAKALDYAHKKRDKQGQPLGIVHRDISPQNVLVSRDGGVKLLDFGIAKAAHVEEGAGELRGKYSYMSPEQALGQRVDARSDLFSLGAVLWELLAGRPLFPYTTQDETLALVREARVPPLREVRAEASQELEGVLGGVLARDPAQRPKDARELQVALTRCLFHEGTIADSVTLGGFVQELEPALQRSSGTSGHHSLHGTAARRASQGPARTVAPDEGDPLGEPFVVHSNLESEITAVPSASGPHRTHPAREPRGATTQAPQPPPTPHPARTQRERKECVLLCGVLRGFSALRAAMGVERWRHLLVEVVRLVESLAYKSQAQVERVNEDGFVLALGLPVSSENDAERALELSLDLVEALEALNVNLPTGAPLSVGVVLGSALVEVETEGERGAERFSWSYDDEAPGRGGLLLAERLARAGVPWEVLVSGRVARRVRFSYKTEQVGAVEAELRGDREEPVAAHRLLGLKSSRAQVQDVRRAYQKMFGRELSLKRLRDVYRKARLRHVALGALVTGEVGVGKSTLVHEFVSGLEGDRRANKLLVYRGMAELHDKDTAYASIATLLLEILGLERGADRRVARDRLRGLEQTLLAGLDDGARRRTLLGLASLMGLHLDGEGSLERLDPDDRKAWVHESLRRLLGQMAAHAPVVFALEDVQNVDASSLEFLGEYLEQPQEGAVFFLLTSLPQPSPPPSWRRLCASVEVEVLDELPTSAALELARAWLPEPLAAHEGVVDALVARAGGNPLYLRESIELLREQPPSDARALLLQLTAHEAAPQWLPTTVEGLLTSRMDRLPHEARKTLQRCAVLGLRFGLREVEAVLGALGPHAERALNVEAELGRLERLVREGFLVRLDEPEADAATPRGPSWAFGSALAREVAARGLVELERAELHGLAAQDLLERQGELFKRDYAALAHHLDEAGEALRAGEFYSIAAHQALGTLGGEACLRLVERALAKLPRGSEAFISALDLRERALALLGMPHERQAALDELLALRQENGTERQRLQVRGRILRLLHERGELEAFERGARVLCEDAERLGDPSAIGRAQRLLHMALRDRGQHALALLALESSVERFREAGDAEGLWSALVSRGITLRQAGRLREALESYEQALKIVGGQPFSRQVQTTRLNLGLLYVNLGEYDRAMGCYQEALAQFQALGSVRDEALALVNLGDLYVRLGDEASAHRTLVNSVRLARKTRDKLTLADGLVTLGIAHLWRGRAREGEALLLKGERLAQELSHVYLRLHAQLGLVEVKLAQGGADRAREAVALAQQARALAEGVGLVWGRALAASLAAWAHRALGEPAQALAASREAVALAEVTEVDGQDLIWARHARIVRVFDAQESLRSAQRARALVEQCAQSLADPAQRQRFLSSRRTTEVLRG